MSTIDIEELYVSPPPPFGAGLKPYFKLDPDYVNLNNGSYGSAPIPVLQAANALADRIEANPDLFLKLEYLPLLTKAREDVAKLIGAKTDDVVFVPNTTTGVITVLRNFEWEAGDVIILTRHSCLWLTPHGICPILLLTQLSTYTLAFPNTHAGVLETFRNHIQSIPNIEGKKRVAVIDSIVACPGVLLPWQEMVKVCKEEGVYSVVDAAHSIGQEVGIDLGKAQPDFWISNCHKWLYAKRSCAILCVPERNQHIIKSPIPTGYAYVAAARRKEPNFVNQFNWTATIDYTPYITVPDALKFRAWLGGEDKINTYCHELAVKGGKRLAKLWGTSVMDPHGDLTLNMVNVELPFPSSIPYSWDIDVAFRKGLLQGKKAYSTHYWHNGKWWTRVSVQVWNELDDFDKLGKAWLEVILDVLEELKHKSYNNGMVLP